MHCCLELTHSDIPCMCSDTYSDGMAYRTYLSWIAKNKDSVSSIRYDRQPLLPIIEYNILYGNACDIIASTMRESFGMGKVLPFIFAFVGVNGVVEAIVCFVVGTAISMALKKALRYS